jgi:folate-binding protein YgfZ
VILIIHRSLLESVMGFFKAYVMFSKTELADLSDSTLVLGCFGVAGDHASSELELAVDADHRLILVRELDAAQTLWEQRPHGPAAGFRLGLIRAGIPLISAPTSAAFLPQMLDLERLGAVNFAKGCYLGQEVVARAQHRGEVKRRLQQLHWSGPTAPEAGAQFGTPTDPARTLGTIINSVTTPATPDTSVPAGTCLAVVANDAPGPFQFHDTLLTRIA